MAKQNIIFTCLNHDCRCEFDVEFDISPNDGDDPFELIDKIIKKRNDIACPHCQQNKFEKTTFNLQ